MKVKKKTANREKKRQTNKTRKSKKEFKVTGPSPSPRHASQSLLRDSSSAFRSFLRMSARPILFRYSFFFSFVFFSSFSFLFHSSFYLVTGSQFRLKSVGEEILIFIFHCLFFHYYYYCFLSYILWIFFFVLV